MNYCHTKTNVLGLYNDACYMDSAVQGMQTTSCRHSNGSSQDE